jgi:aconitate hydratase
VALVETYARAAGLWADTLANRAVRARAALRPVERGAHHGRPVSNPHRRLPVADLAARGIADDQADGRRRPKA